jgi:hypothetical protein
MVFQGNDKDRLDLTQRGWHDPITHRRLLCARSLALGGCRHQGEADSQFVEFHHLFRLLRPKLLPDFLPRNNLNSLASHRINNGRGRIGRK